MIGYNYDEIQGYYKIFVRGSYKFVLFDKINWGIFKFKLGDIEMFFMGDAGNVGTVWDIQKFNEYKTGIATGFKFNFYYRNKTKISFTVAVAKALTDGRTPVFYFMQEL